MINDLCTVRSFWTGVRLAAIVALTVYAPAGIFYGFTVN